VLKLILRIDTGATTDRGSVDHAHALQEGAFSRLNTEYRRREYSADPPESLAPHSIAQASTERHERRTDTTVDTCADPQPAIDQQVQEQRRTHDLESIVS
jgi:hypothetical protein